MKLRAWLLSSTLAVSVSIAALAQNKDNQQKTAPAATETQPANDQAVVNQEQAPLAGDPEKKKEDGVKHDGSKKDVDAIGHRKVGGFDWYSIDTDIKIGKAYAMELERHLTLVEDPVITEYVNRIGQNLVRNSDATVPFTIKVVDDDVINAVALPGGPLYVNSGLILAADDEAELAGVMAHEIAHVALRHGTRAQSREDVIRLMTLPAILVPGVPGVIVNKGAGLIVPASLLKFSRNFEAEADYFGLQYMYKAGYDPNALVSVFEKIQAREKKKPATLSKAFATHPQTADRMRKSQQEIATILPSRDHYVETTSEFSEVKARVAVLRNQQRLEAANQGKPTLRRTTNKTPSADGDKDADKNEDNRPKLQKRDP